MWSSVVVWWTGGREERYDRSRVIMEEPGGTMERYWVAAHEKVADGRRSVRRRGEETAAGGGRVESPRVH